MKIVFKEQPFNIRNKQFILQYPCMQLLQDPASPSGSTSPAINDAIATAIKTVERDQAVANSAKSGIEPRAENLLDMHQKLMRQVCNDPQSIGEIFNHPIAKKIMENDEVSLHAHCWL